MRYLHVIGLSFALSSLQATEPPSFGEGFKVEHSATECAKDSDCVLIRTDCASCDATEPVNKSHAKALGKKVVAFCKQYKGVECKKNGPRTNGARCEKGHCAKKG